jgi:hypothetical protein
LERKISLFIRDHFLLILYEPSFRHKFVAVREISVVSLKNVLRDDDVYVSWNPHFVDLKTSRGSNTRLATGYGWLESEGFVDDCFHIWDIAHLFVCEGITGARK